MPLDFMQDSRWNSLDKETQDAMIDIAFDEEMSVYPQWKNELPEIKEQARRNYLDDAHKENSYVKYDRGAGMDFVSRAARGITETAKNVAGGFSMYDADAEDDTNPISKAGTAVYNWIDEAQNKHDILKPDLGEARNVEGTIKKGIGSTIESSPATVAIIGASALGALAAPVVAAPVALGATVGAGAMLFHTFFMGNYKNVYDRTKDELVSKGIPLVKAKELASQNALEDSAAEVLTEIADTAVGFKLFGKTAKGLIKQPLKQTIKQLASGGGLKEFGKAVVKDAPVSLLSEETATVLQNKSAQKAGLETASLADAMADTALPALFMPIVFGAAVKGSEALQAKKLYSDLNSKEPTDRIRASLSVAKMIEEPDAQKVWLDTAEKYIKDGEDIPLNEEIVDFAIAKADVEDDVEKTKIIEAVKTSIGKKEVPVSAILNLVNDAKAQKIGLSVSDFTGIISDEYANGNITDKDLASFPDDVKIELGKLIQKGKEEALKNIEKSTSVGEAVDNFNKAVSPGLLEVTTNFDPAGYASEGEALASIKSRKLNLAGFDVKQAGGRWTVAAKKAMEAPSKEPWQMTPSEFVGNTTGDEKAVRLSAHPQQVKAAIAEGKDIPVEVLKYYEANQWARNAIEKKGTTNVPSSPKIIQPEATSQGISVDQAEQGVAKIETHQTYSVGNPFAGKAERYRKIADRLSGATARESAMAESFPLGVGGSGKRAQNTNRQIDASVKRAGESVRANKSAAYYEAQAAAFDAGKIDKWGRRITPESAKRSEKSAEYTQSKNERIAEAKKQIEGKEPWEVTGNVYATSSGYLGGHGKGLVIEDHKDHVAKALSEGKQIPSEVLAEYPDLKQAEAENAKTPDPTDTLIEQYNAAGWVAKRHPTRKAISLNGGRLVSEAVAVQRMTEALAKKVEKVAKPSEKKPKPAKFLTQEQVAKRNALLSVPANQAMDFIVKNGFLNRDSVTATFGMKAAIDLNRRYFNRAPFGRLGSVVRPTGKLGLDEVAAEFPGMFGNDNQNPDEHLLDVLLDRGKVKASLEGKPDKEIGDEYREYLANKYGASDEEIADALSVESIADVKGVHLDETASEEGLSEDELAFAARDAEDFFDDIIAKKQEPAEEQPPAKVEAKPPQIPKKDTTGELPGLPNDFNLAAPKGGVGDKLNTNDAPRNAELFGGKKTNTLPSNVNFGGNIKEEDAANLVDKAHELLDARKAEGQKELNLLGRDGVTSLAEKAKAGDDASLYKLDSLLADVSGGPGNFKWGADTFVKALDKYLPALNAEPARQPWETTFSEWKKLPPLGGEGPYWAAFNRAIMAKSTFEEAQNAARRKFDADQQPAPNAEGAVTDDARDKYATQKMQEYRDANADKWAKKYGQSWYNERSVLDAQKRVYTKAWQGYPGTEANTKEEDIPSYTLSEKGLVESPKKVYNANQGGLFDENKTGEEVSNTNGKNLSDRPVPLRSGRKSSSTVQSYVPEQGTLPNITSEPIGKWESSRTKVKTAEDAAIIARDNLSNEPQEQFFIIITDKNGNILSVNQHSIGGPASSQVAQSIVSGQIINTPDAEKAWLVHNHPSGNAQLSPSDTKMGTIIKSLVEGSGVDVMPIIAVTPASYSNRESDFQPLSPKEPPVKNFVVVGRKFSQNPSGLAKLSFPDELSEFGRKYLPDGGIVLLSIQSEPLAIINVKDFSRLRPNHVDIMREAERLNATRMIIYDGKKVLTETNVKNIVNFAATSGIELLTVYDASGDHHSEASWMYREAVRKIYSTATPDQFYMAQRGEIGEEPTRNAEEQALVDAVNTMRENEPAQGYSPQELADAYKNATGQAFPYQELITILKKLGTTVSFDSTKINNRYAAAVYDTGTNQIIFGNSTMKYTDDPIGKYSEIIAHEGIHAILINMRDVNMPAYIEMRSELNNFLKDITPHLATADYFTQIAIEKITDENLVDELVTLGFTNKDFAKWLNSIPGKGAESVTLWGRFKEIIRNIIGKITGITKLDELNSIMDSVMQIGEAGERGDISGLPQQEMVAAWHGGRKLEGGKFDPKYIGSAQGTAVGWGFYFSDLKEVGEYYAEASKGGYENRELLKEYFKPGNIVPSYGGQDRVIALHETKTGDWAAEVIAVDREGNDKRGERPRIHHTYPDQADFQKVLGKQDRNLYQVSLHKGKEEGEYTWLDWDKRISRENESKILKQLREEGIEVDGRFKEAITQKPMSEKEYMDIYTLPTGSDQYKTYVKTFRPSGKTGAEIYGMLSYQIADGLNKKAGSDLFRASEKDASDFLLRAGIDGNRVPVGYFGNAEEAPGKYNYVVFDPNAITVENHIQYALAKKAPVAAPPSVRYVTLNEVKSAFPNQRVDRRGDNFIVTLKNGIIVRVSNVPVIEENSIALEIGYGAAALSDTTKVIAGSYQRDTSTMQHTGLIKLVKSANGVYNLSHESVHFLTDFGLITKMERMVIDREAKLKGKWNNELSRDENEAYYLADVKNAPKPGTTAGRVWAKIQDFIDRLRNLFGDRTVAGIVRDMESGEIFERGLTQNEGGQEQYAIENNKKNATELVKDLNTQLAKQLGKEWNNAFTTTTDIPRSIQGIIGAFEATFKTRVVAVTPREEAFSAIGGQIFKGTLFVNPDATKGFLQLAGHELLHKIGQEDPDLYKTFLSHARNAFRGIEGYEEAVAGTLLPGESALPRDQIEEELIADFTGDALADPKFLKDFSRESPGVFKQFMQAVINWLKDVSRKLSKEGFGSSEYFDDVDSLRERLDTVLHKFAGRDNVSGDNSADISYSRETKKDATQQWIDSILSNTTAAIDEEHIQKMGGTKEARAKIEKQNSDFQSSLKDVLNDKGIWRSTKSDLTIIDRALATPLHSFEKVPTLWRMFLASQGKIDNQNIMLDRMTKDPVTGEIYTQTMHRAGSKSVGEYLSPGESAERLAEYKKYADYRDHQDRFQVGYEVAPYTKKTFAIYENIQMHEERTGTRETNKAARMVAKGFKTEAEAWSNAVELELEDFKKAGFSDEMAGVLKADKMVINNGFNVLTSALRDMIAYYKEKKLPLPETTVKIDGKKTTINLKAALVKMGERRGYYFPRNRNQGKFALTASQEGLRPYVNYYDVAFQNATQQEQEKIFGTTTGEKKPSVIKSLLNAATPLGAQIRKLRAEGFTDENIHVDIANRVTEDVYEMAGSIMAMEEKINKALENMDNSIDEETIAAFAEALSEQVANIEMGRGYRMHMISRSEAIGDEVPRGYELDPAVAVAQYAAGIAGGEAKKDMALKLIRQFTGTDISWGEFQDIVQTENEYSDWKSINPGTAVTEDVFDKYNGLDEADVKGGLYAEYARLVKDRKVDSSKQKEAYRQGSDFMKHMLRNPESGDRVMGTIAGIAVFKYLAGRVSAPVINVTNLATGVPASMKLYAGIPIGSAIRYIGKGLKLCGQYHHGHTDMGKALFGDVANLSTDDRYVMDEINKRNWDISEFNKEGLGALESKLSGGLRKIVEIGMYAFGVSEQINRAATIVGAYKAIRNHSPELSKEDALLKAKYVSDKAHSEYSKANKPTWIQQSGGVAKVIGASYLFKGFSHNYLQNMKRAWGNSWRPQNATAFGWFAILPALLAGAGATVGEEVMVAAAKALGIGGDDPEEEFYNWAKETFGEMGGRFAQYGVFGLLGVNLKGSLRIGLGDLDLSLPGLLGAPGSMLYYDPMYAMQSLKKGAYSKALERVLPIFMSSPLKGIREYNEGLTTQSNTPVFFGKERVMGDEVSLLLRIFSFNPARLSDITDTQWGERKIQTAYRDVVSELNARIKAYYLQSPYERDPNKWADIQADINEYNRRIEATGALKKGLASRITPKRIRSLIKRQQTPTKVERLREDEE